MALSDHHYKIRSTVVTEAGQPDHNEADFSIEDDPANPVPFVLDDIIAACNYLKTQKNIPGTAVVGAPVAFPLRW